MLLKLPIGIVAAVIDMDEVRICSDAAVPDESDVRIRIVKGCSTKAESYFVKVMGRSGSWDKIECAELHVIASRGRTGEHLVISRRAIRRSNP